MGGGGGGGGVGAQATEPRGIEKPLLPVFPFIQLIELKWLLQF